MREDVDPPVLEPERGINKGYETIIAGNEGWNPQGPCLLMRWMADEVVCMTRGCAIVTWCPCDRVRHLKYLKCGGEDLMGALATIANGSVVTLRAGQP